MSYVAEQHVIGALFMDPKCISEIYNTLSAEMFSEEIYGRIYLEFQRGYDNRYDVNIAVILQKMKDSHFPEYLVIDEIKTCSVITETSANVKSYAAVIVKDYKANRLKTMLNRVQIVSDDIDNQIGQIITNLEALQDCKNVTSKSLPDIVRENKDKYFVDNESEKIYIGFSKLDDMLGGLEGGDMIVIGARPSVGKSAFVTQITSNLAKRGKKVGFYNLEMKNKQVYERFVVSESGIGLTRLRRAKKFLGDEEERFRRANEILEKRNEIVISDGSKSVSEIRFESRHMGYDIIIIDYLQLLKSDNVYRGNRTAEVGAISKAIKALAMELNIPIIALSQLNRVSEMREAKEPTMAELREAGDIEQDASVIILMWNLSQNDKSKKGCKVEKQRQGQTGTVVLHFNGDLMRFEESNESISEAKKWDSVGNETTPFD